MSKLGVSQRSLQSSFQARSLRKEPKLGDNMINQQSIDDFANI